MNDSISDSFEDDDFDDNELFELLDNKLKNNDTKQQPPIFEYEEIEKEPSVKILDLTHHKVNYAELTKYIYPTNYEVRKYQFDIVKHSFYENLICAIPTGAGKTFIAAVVMLNYYRWFPESKIIFVAPTRPLVAQQIKAAIGMTSINPSDVAVFLDKSKKRRAILWKNKRVVFATPQVIENDLKSGFINPKSISLLVIDEAHRAKGNYAYNNIIRFLKRFTLSFRILALTATPGADIAAVQEIVNNLMASRIEIRTEKSPDVARYMKHKEIEKHLFDTNDDIDLIIDAISEAVRPALEIANKQNVYHDTDPSMINAFKAMECSQKVINNPRYSEGLKWYIYFILQLLNHAGQMLRRLKVYGVKSFYSYFENKYREFTAKYDTGKSTNKIAADFYYHDSIKNVYKDFKVKFDDTAYIGHPKLEFMIDELIAFFADPVHVNSRVIIFTELRESALDIVKVLDNATQNIDDSLHTLALKPHIFIGQSREKEKFDDADFRKKNSKGKKRKTKQQKEEEEILKAEEERQTAEDARKGRESRRTGLSETAQLFGMSQKQQKQVINEFKSGIYNILVATSIGEEGLDIGEVDLIICYDATSSPIKNIQRMGRTGRKKDGKVLLLLTELESKKFEQSMISYEVVQNQIRENANSLNHYHNLNDYIGTRNVTGGAEGSRLKLIESDRIIPKEFEPECKEEEISGNDDFLKDDDELNDDEVIKLASDYMNAVIKNKRNKQKLKATNIRTNTRTSSFKDSPRYSNECPENQRVFENTSYSKADTNEDSNYLKVPQKRFFMPDNVETGFRSASSLIKRKGEILSLADKMKEQKMEATDSRKRDRLSAFLDSDSDEDTAFGDLATKKVIRNDSDSSITAKNSPESPFAFDNHTGTESHKPLLTVNMRESETVDSLLDFTNDLEDAVWYSLDFENNSATKEIEANKSQKAKAKAASPEFSKDISNCTKSKEILDEEITIQKVIKKPKDKDIKDMIKNTIGAIEIKNNQIISNTVKRSLGARKRHILQSDFKNTSIESLTDAEVLGIMRRNKLLQAQKQASERQIKDSQRKLRSQNDVDLKSIDDSLFPMNKFGGRSGFLPQRQEQELYHGDMHEAANYLSFEIRDLNTPRRVPGIILKSRVSQSNSGKRLMSFYCKLQGTPKDTSIHLRMMTAAQKKQEFRERKNPQWVSSLEFWQNNNIVTDL